MFVETDVEYIVHLNAHRHVQVVQVPANHNAIRAMMPVAIHAAVGVVAVTAAVVVDVEDAQAVLEVAVLDVMEDVLVLVEDALAAETDAKLVVYHVQQHAVEDARELAVLVV